MAKRGKSRRRRRYLRGNIDLVMPLLTLADNDVLSQAVSGDVDERTFVSSIDVTVALREMNAADSPLVIGFAHSDYTAAEIEEFAENANSWSEGNLVDQEIAKRQIVILGTIASSADLQIALNDGKLIKKKAKGMILLATQGIQFWVLNKSGNALTTGADLVVNGHANLWPSG